MATTTTTPETAAFITGASFLVEERRPSDVSFPEDFNEEQRETARTADQFMTNEVMPAIPAMEAKKPGIARALMTKAAELGLPAVLVPEKYDGLESDMTTAMVVSESVGRYASFSTTFGAHTGIGTLPLVYFGTPEQKAKYLPSLLAMERMGAYCLSEPHSGSDALAARARAELSADGSHYVLNGEKMWITNGGWADLFTIFAKIDGDKFTAFLVERDFPGLRNGAEEHKMGIRGSSTTPVILEDCQVPAENVLGEIGRGHIIAFNILNLGRLKLGASCVGGMKEVLAESARYANQRKAFGKSISEFGAIRSKLADMAARTFASESVVYRIAGMINPRLAVLDWDAPDAEASALRCIEEYAVECSIAKVYASDSMDFVADEGVQIHGGYGFHMDYAVERAYRDSRINRIFEGTNEINRLLTASMLFKRAAKGRVDLQTAVGEASARIMSGRGGTTVEGPLGAERALVANAKTAALGIAGLAHARFGNRLEEEQEVLAAIGDMAIAIFAAESAVLRAAKLQRPGKSNLAANYARLTLHETLEAVVHAATTAAPACADAADAEQLLRAIRRLLYAPPTNLVELRREIAAKLTETETYTV